LHPHPIAASALILALIVVTFCYVAACAVWPFANCRKCRGAGRHRSPSGRAWRYCHRCDGTGARRRIWNYLRNLHKEGHR
jgi:hypothetical protein